MAAKSGRTVFTDGSGVAEVRFLYENTPGTEHQARSPRHAGSCRLSVTGRAPRGLAGSYFTSRFTVGDMDLALVDRSMEYATFVDARAADRQTAAAP
ncbi:hypothetical protein [Streptomyces sp. CB01881]|uniref:hypothetical protein n=1 Tax=Streptomyces sp. CB01881 TaxID=2078691 RepID=UPI000CDC0F85|nr:hypothetical protein [Streptomyces sp. CB01881]AUY53834.1 hypothetical protein C2142_39050 [Streptomyces sp. CB01881]TYC68841.1 hypothetical protein EH183_39040 [Streptomyces sp. CB01881]